MKRLLLNQDGLALCLWSLIPLFAGNAGGHRLVTFAGYTSTKEGEGRMKGNYVNSFNKESMPVLGFSYDNFISKLATGIGFFTSWNNSDERTRIANLNSSALKTGVVISPKVSLKGKYTIAPSIGLTYKHWRFALSDIYSYPINGKYDALNLSAGLLFNSERFYLGYSYYFVPFKGKDVYTFYEDKKQTHVFAKMYGIVQTGFKYQRNKESKTSYSLQAAIRVDKYFEGADLFNNINFTVKHKSILFGVATAEGFNNFFPPRCPYKMPYMLALAIKHLNLKYFIHRILQT
ncbi:MAG: type IX secretion system membrane protein PorP/SprF [Sporocytophaga sp.]|nr:type IX secretion system membrane protein PorP/SprF [Sporocytophaga sp.]